MWLYLAGEAEAADDAFVAARGLLLLGTSSSFKLRRVTRGIFNNTKYFSAHKSLCNVL